MSRLSGPKTEGTAQAAFTEVFVVRSRMFRALGLTVLVERLSPRSPYARTVFFGPVGPNIDHPAVGRIHMFTPRWIRSWRSAGGVAANVFRTYIAVYR